MDESEPRSADVTMRSVEESSARFRDLPLNLRWEVTRRHPLYQLFWEGAQRHCDGDHFGDETLAQTLYAQWVRLGAIGVTGRPVDPATPVEAIMAGGGPEWHGVAVRPISLRALCVLLLRTLPEAERLQLGKILIDSASHDHAVPGDVDRAVQIGQAINQLAQLPSAALDKFSDVSYFYVYDDASETSITREIVEQVRRRRTTPRPDRRLRLDKIPGQLDVWDLREGWNAGVYDLAREQRFADIARSLEITVSTAIDRYKAAFELILGVPFRREDWWTQFGRIKYGMAGLEGREDAPACPRWSKSPSPRPVPEALLTPAGDMEGRQGIVTNEAFVQSDAGSAALRMDLEALIASGRSDAEIAEELGFVGGQRLELVAALRDRVHELDDLF